MWSSAMDRSSTKKIQEVLPGQDEREGRLLLQDSFEPVEQEKVRVRVLLDKDYGMKWWRNGFLVGSIIGILICLMIVCLSFPQRKTTLWEERPPIRKTRPSNKVLRVPSIHGNYSGPWTPQPTLLIVFSYSTNTFYSNGQGGSVGP